MPACSKKHFSFSFSFTLFREDIRLNNFSLDCFQYEILISAFDFVVHRILVTVDFVFYPHIYVYFSRCGLFRVHME